MAGTDDDHIPPGRKRGAFFSLKLPPDVTRHLQRLARTKPGQRLYKPSPEVMGLLDRNRPLTPEERAVVARILNLRQGIAKLQAALRACEAWLSDRRVDRRHWAPTPMAPKPTSSKEQVSKSSLRIVTQAGDEENATAAATENPKPIVAQEGAEWDPCSDWSVETVVQNLGLAGRRQRTAMEAIVEACLRLPERPRHKGKGLPEILDSISAAELHRTVAASASADSCEKFLAAWKAWRAKHS
jgi:hypothetical protein